MTTGARIEDVRLADLDRLLQVHLHGAIRCIQAAMPWLRRSAHASIVNIPSRLGSISRIAEGAYDHLQISYAMRISKVAQNMRTACLHRELAPPAPSTRSIRAACARGWAAPTPTSQQAKPPDGCFAGSTATARHASLPMSSRSAMSSAGEPDRPAGHSPMVARHASAQSPA